MELLDSLSPRRRELLDAAVTVAARDGLRGLTHRAVDRQARLPEGSCSAYLRTRAALQEALAEYVAAQLTRDVESLAHDLTGCEDDRQAAARTSAMFLDWLDHPELTRARLELTLEASRDGDLAAHLGTSRSRLVDIVETMMADRGKEAGRHRAETLVGALDGVLLTGLMKPPRGRKAFVTGSIELLLDSVGGHGET